MPTYCYEDQFGQVIERVYAMGKAPREIKSGTSKYRRSLQAEMPSIPSTAGWPMECSSSGVNAEQAQDLRNHFDKAGVRTEVTPEGRPVYRDMDHRKKALKCRGMFDKDAFC